MAYNDVGRGMGVLEFRYVASDLNVARTVGVVNEVRRSLAYGKNGSDSAVDAGQVPYFHWSWPIEG